MVFRIHTRLVLGAAVCLLITMISASDVKPVAMVDLGWLRISQAGNEWIVANVSDPLPSSNSLRTNDVLVSVDGQSVRNLSALSVARIVSRITLNAKTVIVRRKNSLTELRFHDSSEPLASFLLIEANTNPVTLYTMQDKVPDFSLMDASGRAVNINFGGKWTLIHVWNTMCDPYEVAALNEMAEPAQGTLKVVSVAMNDTPSTIEQFSVRERIKFTTLIGGLYDGAFAAKFNYFALRTDILVDPDGQVVFVGSGPTALAGAWKMFRERTAQ